MKKSLNVNVLRLLTVQFIILSALTLTACGSLKVQEQASPFQQNLLAKCPSLSKHDGTTGAMVLETLIIWAGEYNECAERHNALVDAITQKGRADE